MKVQISILAMEDLKVPIFQVVMGRILRGIMARVGLCVVIVVKLAT